MQLTSGVTALTGDLSKKRIIAFKSCARKLRKFSSSVEWQLPCMSIVFEDITIQGSRSTFRERVGRDKEAIRPFARETIAPSSPGFLSSKLWLGLRLQFRFYMQVPSRAGARYRIRSTAILQNSVGIGYQQGAFVVGVLYDQQRMCIDARSSLNHFGWGTSFHELLPLTFH